MNTSPSFDVINSQEEEVTHNPFPDRIDRSTDTPPSQRDREISVFSGHLRFRSKKAFALILSSVISICGAIGYLLARQIDDEAPA